jgi:DNA-directed RNA polymerase specialized sigma24 family protein
MATIDDEVEREAAAAGPRGSEAGGAEDGRGDRHPPTLRPSLVQLALGGTGPESARALAVLYETCREPAYVFIRSWSRGPRYDHARTEDLLHAFFLRCIEKQDLVKGWDPARTPFRKWLFVALNHFLLNDKKRNRALIRDWRVCSFIEDLAGKRRWRDPSHGLTPEIEFDQIWARILIGRAQSALRKRYEVSGNVALYDRLAEFLPKGSRRADQPSYPLLSAELGRTVVQLKQDVFRMRRRWMEVLRQSIADYVDGPQCIDDEIRCLIAALSVRAKPSMPLPPAPRGPRDELTPGGRAAVASMLAP